jgi:hypothetical protein
MTASAQDCSNAWMQGYRGGDTTVSVAEARRVILTSFAAITSCNMKLKLRSGNFYYYDKDGNIVLVENFRSPLDDATKLRLIDKLKPGVKLLLEDMRYGDENKAVPTVALMLVKG